LKNIRTIFTLVQQKCRDAFTQQLTEGRRYISIYLPAKEENKSTVLILPLYDKNGMRLFSVYNYPIRQTPWVVDLCVIMVAESDLPLNAKPDLTIADCDTIEYSSLTGTAIVSGYPKGISLKRGSR